MVAKSQLKFIKSLHQKKYRSRHGLFLAEGVKTVGDLTRAGWRPRFLYTTEDLPGLEGATPISELFPLLLPSLECPVCYACLVMAKTLNQYFDLVTLLNKRGMYDQRVVPGRQLPLNSNSPARLCPVNGVGTVDHSNIW